MLRRRPQYRDEFTCCAYLVHALRTQTCARATFPCCSRRARLTDSCRNACTRPRNSLNLLRSLTVRRAHLSSVSVLCADSHADCRTIVRVFALFRKVYIVRVCMCACVCLCVCVARWKANSGVSRLVFANFAMQHCTKATFANRQKNNVRTPRATRQGKTAVTVCVCMFCGIYGCAHRPASSLCSRFVSCACYVCLPAACVVGSRCERAC